MLRSVRLENFKRFGEPVSLPLGRVTLILGPNSVGKSCLFKALRLLAQSWVHPSSINTLIFEGDRVTLNTFASVVHRNNTTLPLRFEIAEDRADGGVPVADAVRFEFRGDGANLCSLREIVLDGEFPWTFTAAPRDDDSHTSDALRLDIDVEHRMDDAETVSFDAVGPLGEWFERRRVAAGISPDSCRVAYVRLAITDAGEAVATAVPFPLGPPVAGSTPTEHLDQAPPDEAARASSGNVVGEATPLPWSEEGRALREELERFVRQRAVPTLDRVRRSLRQLSHIGRVRHACPEYVTIYDEGTEGLAVGKSGEHLPRILGTQPLLVADLNVFLDQLANADPRRRLPSYEVVVTPPPDNDWKVRRIYLKHKAVDGTQLAWTKVTEVGAGIGQIMPILVEWSRLAREAKREQDRHPGTDTRKTLLMEQPELHLHPAHQTALMSMLAGFHPDTHERVSDAQYVPPQVIIETHSEHMVMRAQTLVRSGLLLPDEVSILALSADDKGETVAKRIPLSPEGEFEDFWPDGFFDERFEEQYRSITALHGTKEA